MNTRRNARKASDAITNVSSVEDTQVPETQPIVIVEGMSEQQAAIVGDNSEGIPESQTSGVDTNEVDETSEVEALPPTPTAETNPVIAAMHEQEIINNAAIEANRGIGDNNPPVQTAEDKRKDEIILSYKPERKLLDASADARETISQIANNKNDHDGSLLSRLTRDLADMGYYKISTPGSGIVIGESMSRDLISALAKGELPLLGNEIEYKDTDSVGLAKIERKVDGNMVLLSTNAVVDTVSPYGRDIKTISSVRPASMRACLVLDGAKTGVTYGYIRKDDYNGKRFSRSMTFLARKDIDEDTLAQKGYWEAVCVPNNVIVPSIYTVEQRGEDNHLVPLRPSDDTTLRYLTDDWAQALYDHHFAGKGLYYDTVCKAKAGNPSGLLIKAPVMRAPQTPSVTPKPATAAKAGALVFDAGDITAIKFEDVLKAPVAEQKAFFEDWMKEHAQTRQLASGGHPASMAFAEHVNILANIMKDAKARNAMPDTVLAVLLRLGRLALDQVMYHLDQNKIPDGSINRELMLLDQRFGEKEGTRFIRFNENKEIYSLYNDKGEFVCNFPAVSNGNGEAAKAA